MSRRDRTATGAILLGGLTFAICVALGWLIWTRTPLRQYELDIVTAAPAPPDHYLAHDRGGHVDHHVLFHGLDESSVEHMREADVLLLGNSRLMFALRGDAIRRYFLPRGLRPFALGFGHLEQSRFPLELIRRHDLHPRVVIANIDDFFGGVTSPWAQRVLGDTTFDAWKTAFEAATSHTMRRAMHRVVPHVADLWEGEREFVIYRSRRDGSWFSATGFGHGSRMMPFYTGRDVARPHNLELARAFKDEVEARGARLIFVLVPGRDVSLTHAQMIADATGVPLVAPEVPGMRTMDGSHLTDESAAVYAQAFFQHLDPVLDRVLAGEAPAR